MGVRHVRTQPPARPAAVPGLQWSGAEALSPMVGAAVVGAVVLMASCVAGPERTPAAESTSATEPGTSADSTVSTAADATVSPDVQGLSVRIVGVQRVAPNVIELRLELRNMGEAPVDLSPLLGIQGGWLRESFVATPDGQRRFFVLQGADGSPVVVEPPPALPPGQTAHATARYGALPADIAAIDFFAKGTEPTRGLMIPQ